MSTNTRFHVSINPFTAPACKMFGLKDARTRQQTVYFQSCNTSTFNDIIMPFNENPFTCSAKKKTKRVSVFAVLLLVFKRHHGSEEVKRALPLSKAGTATSIIFVARKYIFCRDKGVLVETELLSQQPSVCRDRMFLSRQNVYLSRQT